MKFVDTGMDFKMYLAEGNALSAELLYKKYIFSSI
jgi:hypothetical protein